MDRRTFLTLAASTATAGLTVSTAHAQGVAPLGGLRTITVTAPDVAAIEAAYARYLGYDTVWRGVVAAEAARSWGAPGVAGRRVVVMAPAVDEAVQFRFVEQALPAGYRPLATFGWAAAEIRVQDPDALAAQLRGSPFEIIGPPKTLPGWPNSKAMQVVGPGREVLYFTHLAADPDHPGPWAQSPRFVGTCFIAVAGVPDIKVGVGFYETAFGNRAFGEYEIENKIISDANRLPVDAKHRLNTVKLANSTMIEVDHFPATATARARPARGLAPGIPMVSFSYGDLTRTDLPWVAQAAEALGPLDGRARTLAGPGGALFELVQA